MTRNHTKLTCVFLLLCSIFVQAQTPTVFTGTGNWNDAARWSEGIPTATKDAVIFTGATCTINNAAQCKDLTIRQGGTLTIDSGNLVVAANILLSGTMDASNSKDSITLSGSFMGNGSFKGGESYLILNGTQLFSGSFNPQQSKVCYCGNQNQNLLRGTYHILLTGGSGEKILPDTVRVHHALNLQAASLFLNNKTLIVQGIIESTAGNIKGSASSSVILEGADENITLLPMLQQAGSNVLGNLTINKTGGTVVTLSSPVGISGSLKMVSGQLYAGNYLTLLADANEQGSIEAIPATANVSGNITVQKYIRAGNRRWIHLGIPIQDAAYTQLLDDIFVTGTPSSQGFDHNATGNASAFTYDETLPGDEVTNGWVAPLQVSEVVTDYKAIKFFFRGDRSDTTVLYTQKNTSAAIIDFTGTVNTGTINIPLQYTNAHGNDKDDGWNFISNPYPSNIDWEADGWVKKDLENTIWIWNPVCNSYGVWNKKDGTNGVSSVIPQGGGFWVKAKKANAALSISEAVKTSKKPTLNFFKANTSDHYHVHIRFSLDTLTYDETILDFEAGGQKNNVDSGDALKLKGDALNLWTLSGEGNGLAINVNPLPFAGDTIPLLFSTQNLGICTLRFNEVTLPENINMLLVDHYTGKSYHATDGYELRILVNEEAASRSASRFQLIFLTNRSTLVLQEAKPNINCSEINLRWFTAYELHNRHYRIERSIIDSNHFATLNVVLPKDTHYLYASDYMFKDNAVYKGKAYYRIVREFLDGMLQYSNMMETDCSAAAGEEELEQASFRVYPIPYSSELHLSIPSEFEDKTIQLHMYDMNGQTIRKEYLNVTGDKVQLDFAAGLPAGCYFLELSSGKYFRVFKVLKI